MKALAAYRQQKACEADGLFVVEGIKMAEEALRSGWTIRVLCATPEAWRAISDRHDATFVSVELYEAKPEQIERLSSLRTPQGIWLLVERPQAVEVSRNEDFVLALDGIQDPGNMGTILRTCDWFGVRHVLCSRETVSCYNPKVVQATMGAIFRTRVEYGDLPQRLVAMKEDGYRVYGAMLDGEDAFRATIGKPSLLVIGNEGHGISAKVAETIDCRLTIPNIGGTCESLNASVATGILVSLFAQR